MKNYSSFSNDRKIGSLLLRHSRTVENREPIGDHIFFAFGNLPKVTVNSNKARAILREIPEDVSVRKPPLKEEARRQRTLTLENDELYPSFSNDRKIGSPILRHSRTVENREPTGDHIFFAFGKNPPGADFRVARRARIRDDTRNLPKASVDFIEARASLREIPEDASVRKPPLKEKARRQRTLTLENDEVISDEGAQRPQNQALSALRRLFRRFFNRAARFLWWMPLETARSMPAAASRYAPVASSRLPFSFGPPASFKNFLMAVRRAERWLMLRLRRLMFWRARLRACGELAKANPLNASAGGVRLAGPVARDARLSAIYNPKSSAGRPFTRGKTPWQRN